jgi:hypothetical protein
MQDAIFLLFDLPTIRRHPTTTVEYVRLVGFNWSFYPRGKGPFPAAALHILWPENF